MAQQKSRSTLLLLSSGWNLPLDAHFFARWSQDANSKAAAAPGCAQEEARMGDKTRKDGINTNQKKKRKKKKHQLRTFFPPVFVLLKINLSAVGSRSWEEEGGEKRGRNEPSEGGPRDGLLVLLQS